MRFISVLFLFLLLTAAAAGQPPVRVEIPTIPADPKDVATIDSIIKAFYEAISGPAGQPRQWGRDKTLYIPGVKFVSMSEQGGKIAMRIRDHQQFVDSSNAGLVRDDDDEVSGQLGDGVVPERASGGR